MEATQNSILSGSDSRLFVNRVIDLVDNEAPKGGSVTLTIDPAAQQAAFDGLNDLGDNVRGAVVAIEPRTGKILAMVSSPSYNPNKLASHDFNEVGKAKQRLEEDKLSPLNNRAIEEVLPPGSTFKLVTAAAALDSGKYNPDSQVPGGATPRPAADRHRPDQRRRRRLRRRHDHPHPGARGLLQRVLRRRRHEGRRRHAPGHRGEVRLRQRSFHDLDDALTRQALSRFPEDPDEPQTALSAIGQFDVAATPLQMAMVGAGIANDGVVMKPYLVDEIKSPKLDVIDKTDPEPMPDQPAISSAAARDLTQMMVSVVDNGTAQTAQIPGVEVAGKTGTAQSSPDRPPYAWFVSFAPAETPAVAVAVLVQDAGVARDEISGSGLAAPIAKSVMEAVIGNEQRRHRLTPDSGERYERGERIATGGMGEVWRARDTVLGREVAVKILKHEYADDPTFRARFEAEARHAAGLHHPGIAAVFDYGAAQGGPRRPYLVMELVDGKPLSDLLADGRPFDPEQARAAGPADRRGARRRPRGRASCTAT